MRKLEWAPLIVALVAWLICYAFGHPYWAALCAIWGMTTSYATKALLRDAPNCTGEVWRVIPVFFLWAVFVVINGLALLVRVLMMIDWK